MHLTALMKETYFRAPTFFGYNISVLASVNKLYYSVPLFLDSYLGLRFDGKSYFAIDTTNHTEIKADIMDLFSIRMKFKAESANGILLIIDGSVNEYEWMAIEFCIKEFWTVTIPV